MIVSTQVTFRNMTAIEDVREDVESRIQKLETYCKPILSCRVMIEAPANHHRKGVPFHIRIDATLTDGKIVVKHEEFLYPGKRDDGGKPLSKGPETTSERNFLMLTIRASFDAARRQLQDHARRRRSEVKTHVPVPQATVSKLFVNQGYGYLETADGREIYFHANSVIGAQFEKLKLGSSAEFVEESGQKGPQASTVRILKRSRRALVPTPLPAKRRS